MSVYVFGAATLIISLCVIFAGFKYCAIKSVKLRAKLWSVVNFDIDVES